MKGERVDLDDEIRLRPVEVDLIAVEPPVHERLGETAAETEPEEPSFGTRLRPLYGAALLEDDPPQRTNALAAVPGRAFVRQAGDIEQSRAIRRLDGESKPLRRQHPGEIDQRPVRRRDRDAIALGPVLRWKPAGAVDDDAGTVP